MIFPLLWLVEKRPRREALIFGGKNGTF